MVLKDMSHMYPTYPIIASITMVLCLLPVPVHWDRGNIAIVSVALWVAIGLLMTIVGTIVWHGNIRNPYPIWGDIVQQYFVMLPTAISSCNLWIQYRLWKVASARTVFITKKQKRTDKLFACFCCFGVPAIVGILHYVVQGHRYNLWEDLGPFTETYNVTLAYPLYSIWEPLFCLISALYGIHTFFLLMVRRKELDIVFHSGSTNINKNRYMRLVALAAVASMVHLPLTLWMLVINLVVYKIFPWISWEDTHSNYGRILYVTRFYLSTLPNRAVYMIVAWYSLVLCGLVIFGFYGFGDEPARQYRVWIRALYKLFGVEYTNNTDPKVPKRTWLDVLLRPGRPVDSDSEFTGPDIPGFATIYHASRSYDYGTVTTQGGRTNDVEQSLELPEPAHIPPESRRSRTVTMKMEVQSSSPGGSNMAGIDIDEKRSVDRLSLRKVETDLEAQQEPALTIEQQRRREILEKNPELTEEVSF